MFKHIKLLLCLLLIACFLSINFACSNSNENEHIEENDANNLSKNGKNQDAIIKLEQEVNNLFEGDEILLRRKINSVYKLADLYKNIDKSKAIYYYEKALSVDSANIVGQWELSQLYDSIGKINESVDRATIVFEMAEDSELINESRKYINAHGVKISKDINNNKNISNDVEIVILPIGKLNNLVLESVADLLTDRMKIKFEVFNSLRINNWPHRTYRDRFIDDYYNWIVSKIGNENLKLLIHKYNINEISNENVTPDSQLKFIYSFFKELSPENKQIEREFVLSLRESTKHIQYDLGWLLQYINKKFPVKKESQIKGYLAITDVDLYEGSSRFRFGGALPGFGAISYYRFTSSFNHEHQNRPRLIKRILKQALSSSNFILGIPRCSNPNCARAYSNSLNELDQKSDKLCNICLKNLHNYVKIQTSKNISEQSH